MIRRSRSLAALALICLAALAGLAKAEVVQRGDVRVTISGEISPKRLPRAGDAPISVSLGGQVSTTDKSAPPQLRSLKIELNRVGKINYTGLPLCPYDAIQTASSQRALSACRPALVGRGSFDAEITLAGQDPYPIAGQLLAFNGKLRGKPVLFGQIYSPSPFATSFVIVFSIEQAAKGTYGTTLSASLPAALGRWGNLTGIKLTLSRRYSYQGRRYSYLSAGCPAPRGFQGASFSLARTSFGFAGGPTLTSTLVRNCRAGG